MQVRTPRFFRHLVLLLLIVTACWSQTADLIVRGARVYTVNPAQPTASAIAVKDGLILAVGDNLQQHAGPSTRLVDAQGATILPGLIDSHAHLAGLGQALEVLDLRAASSIEEVQQLVREAAAKAAPGEWIRGRGWDQTRWPGKEFPGRNSLTDAAPNHPVFLSRVDGHAAWANGKALEIAGVDAQTPQPKGGRIVRNKEGQLTGILIDNAMGLVARRVPESTQPQIERRLRAAADACAALGLTSVHDAGAGASVIAAYTALSQRGELPIRSYIMIGGEGELWKQYLAKGPQIGDFVTIRAIKLMADGALGSRGAALIESYTDDNGNRGLSILQKEDVLRVASDAAAKGFQVATHAIGDFANRMTLEAYGKALGGTNDKRFRIEHAQIVHPDDFPLFKKFSVIASIQATHATSDMRWVEDRIGAQRSIGAYAWRTFLDTGVHIANGSDFPVEDPNPMLGFYASITRQDEKGSPAGGWHPGQKLTRDEALKSWTLDGAYAAFEEKKKGSIEPGKFADFIILSRNIMEVDPAAILTTKVWQTYVGGKLVYQDPTSPISK